MRRRSSVPQSILWSGLAFLFLFPSFSEAQEGFIPAFEVERNETALGRLAQPNAYFDKVGRQFAILGLESGTFEAWAYPLKLLRNFEFSFQLKSSSRPIAAREIVRFIDVTPAATTLTFSFQSFTVKATFVAALDQPGAVILLSVKATEPLTIIAGFLPVLQPMWPAGIGGQYASWDGKLKAYLISEPTRRNHGFVGSPAARGISYTPAHMLSDFPNEFMIALENPEQVEGKFIPVVIAGGKGKREDVKKVYETLASDPAAVYRRALEYYRGLKQNMVRVTTPKANLNLAFEWAKVSYDNLRVDNPDLGRGLVAGLGLSGTGGRPGFGWFFGTDAYFNSLSLSSCGALEAAKEALAFTQKWQREDGKMAHELSQAAGYINWFKDYPYGYIHGDTTPYYIVAFYDFYRKSADLDLLKQSWPSLRRAYEWCLTTDADGDGLMDNSRAGLGALEFGSLTGIQTDIYQAAVWIRAAYSMERLARAVGEEKQASKAGIDFHKALAAFEAKFWDAESGQYSYAFNAEGKQVKELTPWCAVPLIWGLGSAERAAQTLENMSAAELATDWGVRILSNKSPLYEPLNYNYGAVWPFLTGYVASAMYAHNQALQGYQLLMANAGHVFDHSLGHATELFSGALHVWPQEAVAHQGFSMGGFVLPFVRGLLGLEIDAVAKEAVFRPSFPPDWREVKLENIRLGGKSFALKFERGDDRVKLEVSGKPGLPYQMTFAPAFGRGTDVHAVKVNGRPANFDLESSGQATRPLVRFGLSGRDAVEIEFDPTVEVLPPAVESRVGDPDRGLKIIKLEREGKDLNLKVQGMAGERYRLDLVHSELVAGVVGAELREGGLEIRIPAGKPGEFLPHEIIIKTR